MRMGQDQLTYRRATGAALLGLGVQFVLAVTVSLLGVYAQSPAIKAAAYYLVGGLPVWLVLALIYRQHTLERDESMEADQIAAAGGGGAALFQSHEQELRVARARLDRFYRWGLPGTSAGLALYLIACGLTWLSSGYQQYLEGGLIAGAVSEQAGSAALMVTGLTVGFIGFIVARYVSGMTRVSEWVLLRGGAGYLLGSSVASLLLFVGGLALYAHGPVLLAVLGLAVPGLMVLLGVEVAFNLVLGLYRPRRPGEVPKPAFQSQLLGWMARPESLAKVIADAINYQFGVEVSRSWFFRLLARAVTPLLAFALVVMVLLSGVVIVAPHQRAVISRYGRLMPIDSPAIAEPGAHLKWPWPVGTAEVYPAGRVQQLVVGSSDHHEGLHDAVLWTNHHHEDADYFVTAPTPLQAGGSGSDQGDTATGLALIGLRVAVQYRVDDLLRYTTSVEDAHDVIKAIAERSVNAYCLTHDIDTLIGTGRTQAGAHLAEQIQLEADALELGVQVLFVGLVAAHPPEDDGVAAAFLEQIDSLQERQTMIEQARQESIERLSSVAGSSEGAALADQQILELRALNRGNTTSSDGTPPTAPEAEATRREVEIEKMLTDGRGEAAQIIFAARAERWRRAISERAKAERFNAERLAFNHAPAYYRAKRYLEVLGESLATPRKYILGSVSVDRPVFRIDLKDAGNTMESIFEGSP